MTELGATAARRGPGVGRLALASAALLAVVFVLLAEQIAAGGDPVLKLVHAPAPQPVIVRRIVRRVVLETTIRRKGHAPPARTTESSSPVVTSQSGGEAPAPVTRSS